MAALISANKLDESVFAGAAADPDEQVRRLAMAGLGGRAQGSIPAAAVDGFVRRGLQDASGTVRYEALRVYGRRLMAADAAPVLAAARDPWPHTALLALDLLGQVAASKDQARALLEKTARGLTANAAAWHAPAHALVSLARIAPEAARPILPVFVSAAAWPVRMYAARAAGLLKDEAALRRLAGDPHDNVRDAALSALAGLIGHQADALFIAALARPDYQLIQTAATSLKQSPAAAAAVPALLVALDRVTGEKRDTSRDPRLALLERIGELATPAAAARIAAYAADFDPAVAAAAAGIIERWTGRKPEVRPRPLPIVRARMTEVEKLGSAVVRVTMAGGGMFEFKLLTDQAPATAARFAVLARAGYYNGLTFHRIVPNFVVQGGSPGANEIMGDGPYLRDEVGLVSHDRGTIGISTRGRDTGDAQLFFNVVDNPRLDHDYTVFARIVSGLDVADRILECAVIDRIEIVFPASPETETPNRPPRNWEKRLIIHVDLEAGAVSGLGVRGHGQREQQVVGGGLDRAAIGLPPVDPDHDVLGQVDELLVQIQPEPVHGHGPDVDRVAGDGGVDLGPGRRPLGLDPEAARVGRVGQHEIDAPGVGIPPPGGEDVQNLGDDLADVDVVLASGQDALGRPARRPGAGSRPPGGRLRE